MDGQDVGLLLERLRDENSRRRSQMRGLIAAWLGIAAGFAVLIGLQWAAKGPPDPATWITIIGAFAGAPTLVTLNSRHTQATREAAALNDPRLAPHLLDVLDSDSFEIQRLAREALTRILPMVTAEMADLFDRRHLHALSGLLKSKSPGMVAATLHALGQVGDLVSIEELERMSRRSLRDKDETVRLQALGSLRHRLAGAEIRNRVCEVAGTDHA